MAEWSRRHGQTFSLTLTDLAGVTFESTGSDPRLEASPGENALELDAVEFCRTLAGRA